MLQWHQIPSKEDSPETPGLVPDFGGFEPAQEYYAVQVEAETIQVFFVLSEEALPFPIVSHEEVAICGINPDRTINGGGMG